MRLDARTPNSEVRMLRRLFAILGGVLAALGFAAGLASLMRPWASYRASAAAAGAAPQDVSGVVPLVELDRGSWYLGALFALFGLLAGVVMARPTSARWMGVAGAVLGAAGLLLVVDLANRLSAGGRTVNIGLASMDVDVGRQTGIWFGLAAAPLLGLGTALLSLRHPAR
jgi:hypothetical protein